ncbi:acetyl-CoA acetyltransferase [Philodulcilactobacillus myokoensis]|uniref:acetyl-CoA C-acetyltransferase n=1 Tax=Philodulcilactobacillus myokoensis TaxID=2929573 RepID=A0A9W6ES45_9LACO|nr:thiolase family protein [Philodulcilactobacillus myokoensis]GLB46028.1 acetyl-CoA acetyltransferase [Philodulcilactobacillus myokoensis]
MKKVAIVSTVRTPIGKIGGELSRLSSVQLGTIVTKSAIKKAQLSPNQIDQVIFGNVLQAGSGQNVARQIQLHSGISNLKTAYTVNQVCGSGMKAIRSGQAAIVMGDAKIVVAGGTESMSNAPFLNQSMRFGHKYGNINMIDSIQNDALDDAFYHLPMGATAENVAKKFNISRKDQDQFAYQSHRKAVKAQLSHKFDDEIVPVKIKDKQNQEKIIARDEGPRKDTSMTKLAKLRTVFQKGGTVTAGNASSLNDGASALVMMDYDLAKKMNLKPLAIIENYVETGIDPRIMGYAPYRAIKQLLKTSEQKQSDIDLFEINEAFAAPSVAIQKNLHLPSEKVNINGGAIALGHPLGDSGARIVTSLIYNLKHEHKRNGIASMCIGGGMGMALQIKV